MGVYLKLKRCPFCGQRTYLVTRFTPDTYAHVVWCAWCYVYGPQAESEKKAIRLWNKRRKNQ